MERTEKLNPLVQEGYILCDKNYTRLKVKSSKYLRLNGLSELFRTAEKDIRKYILIEIVLTGEAFMFIEYCPEWKEVIQEMVDKISSLNKLCLEIYEQIKDLDQGQYAKEVKKKDKSIHSFMFAIRKDYAKYANHV